jgi:toxin-antitoxin system PIN domain toxin
MKGYLLDSNLLIALAWPNHAQHAEAHAWFGKEHAAGWGTCMVTQLAFVRISSHPSIEHRVSTQEAVQKLIEIASLPTHSFWTEPADGYRNDRGIFDRTLPNTLTHKFVTDGYLVTVACLHGGKLATLDKQLARAFAPFAVLV